MAAVLRSRLTAALNARRDNDVVADVGGCRVPVVAVDYCPLGDQIVLRLDPDELAAVLDAAAEPTDPEGNGNE
ncbi:hypothetical protein CSH63_32360 [Micromonospora tulbaghiae]|uniref:Uncharacterized protein n=1 Tax=Micromonospora tulbaghiae TaxID=479978 RepID=A0A386WX86_9ACTN|nr:hypothetical protein CSH63_32360 [Micromonospora tulbaghiae]